MKRVIKFGKEARAKLLEGIELATTAVRTTLGPRGSAAIIHTQQQPTPLLADDGALVSKCIQSHDAAVNAGCSIIKEVATQADTGSGDGTTSSSILAYSVIKKALEAIDNGSSKKKLKDGIVEATKIAEEEIKKLVKQVETEEQLKDVAFVSSNNKEIAELVAGAVHRVGKNGVVQVETGTMQETKVYDASGIKLERGFIDRMLTTDPVRGVFDVKKCKILILDHELDSAQEAIKILEMLIVKGCPLLVICNGCRNEAALSYLRANKQQYGLKICLVRSQGHGDIKVQYLQDIAAATGSTIIGDTTGISLEKLQADKSKEGYNLDEFIALLGEGDVSVNQYATTIVVEEKTEASKEAAAIIEKELARTDLTPYDRGILEERLANLTSGIALIKVGGSTDTEIDAKRVKIDDAKNATVSANKYGYVLGGGSAYLWASKKLLEQIQTIKTNSIDKDHLLGMEIVAAALQEITKQLVTNSGEDESIVASIISSLDKEDIPVTGFDALENKIVNMYEAGIIDSYKVVSNSLTKALSIASTVIMAETLITEEAEESDKINFGLMKR